MDDIVIEPLTLHWHITAPIAAVWNAYASPSKRAQWSVPVGEAMVYDEVAIPRSRRGPGPSRPRESSGFAKAH